MRRHKKLPIGGQKLNDTATVATALAILHLQREYPGTFIQFNPSQVTGDSPYDIEQWESRTEAVWAIRTAAGLPLPWWVESRYPPLRLWEVKGLIQRNKRFPIDLDAHRQLRRKQTRYGISYIFVLFTTWDYSGERLHSDYRIKELPGEQVSRLLAKSPNAKRHRLERRLPRYLQTGKIYEWIPYTDIFEKINDE